MTNSTVLKPLGGNPQELRCGFKHIGGCYRHFVHLHLRETLQTKHIYVSRCIGSPDFHNFCAILGLKFDINGTSEWLAKLIQHSYSNTDPIARTDLSAPCAVRRGLNVVWVASETANPCGDLAEIRRKNAMPAAACRDRLLNVTHNRKLSDLVGEEGGIRPHWNGHLESAQRFEGETRVLLDVEPIDFSGPYAGWQRQAQQACA
jgi:hypothetical protein